jgi:hypothetical protein
MHSDSKKRCSFVALLLLPVMRVVRHRASLPQENYRGEWPNMSTHFDEKKAVFDGKKAVVLSELSRAAYPDRLYSFELWHPEELKPFETENFTGFITSNKEMTVVSFRGTNIDLRNYEELKKSIGQWLRNFDFSQEYIDGNGGYRIHRGYYRELFDFYDELVGLIGDQYSDGLPLYLTGHSAGAALATLAGNFLAHDKRTSITPAATFVYSSPRVGDRKFTAQYPIPLFRFERGYDIVPHFPFSPLFYKWISKAQIDHVISKILQIFKFLGADIDPAGVLHEKVEYVHAGHLLYHENDEATALYTTSNFETQNVSAIERISKIFLDGNRFFSLLTKAYEQLEDEQKDKEVSFVEDHNIDPHRKFLKMLLLPSITLRAGENLDFGHFS